jgi:transcriptional regulator with XRE-family HTH domain
MTGETSWGDAGSTLRRLRNEAGLTQAEVASRLGWDKTRLSKYENGRLQMSIRVIEEIATALGFKPEAVILELLTVRYPSLKRTKAGKLTTQLLEQLYS